MTRHQSRESAFVLVFEKMFNSELSLDDMITYARQAGSFEVDTFAENTAKGVEENKEEIDGIINENLVKWAPDRIPKVTRAMLRVAVYEIKYTSVPRAVIANEAVEIVKTYSTDKDASFVNGVISSVLKKENA